MDPSLTKPLFSRPLRGQIASCPFPSLHLFHVVVAELKDDFQVSRLSLVEDGVVSL